MRNLILGSFLFLAACPTPECEESGNCESGETDSQETDQQGEGTLIVHVTLEGEALDCNVTATGPETATWSTAESPGGEVLDAGTYEVSVERHALPDGNTAIGKPIDALVKADLETEVTIETALWFDDTYACFSQGWQYVPGNPENKGAGGNVNEQDSWHIRVRPDLTVENVTDNRFNGLLENVALLTRGRGFALEGNAEYVYQNASITPRTWWVEWILDEYIVWRLTCEK